MKISQFLPGFIFLTFFISCSGNSPDPVAAPALPSLNSISIIHGNTILWNYYDVGIDPENQTLEFAENRSAMFTANVVTFLNNDPASLTFKINQFTNTGDNIYVDLDLTITHPLGNEGFNGYDVRGIFIGNGSGSFDSDPSLTFPDPYIDATLINADGYTRWFNLEEFFNDGLFGFTQGMYSTKNYNFTSDINPYKYFAAGLGAYDDLWPYLNATSDFGVFTYSSSQTRNYRINFPFPVPGIKYGYSIAAD